MRNQMEIIIAANRSEIARKTVGNPWHSTRTQQHSIRNQMEITEIRSGINSTGFRWGINSIRYETNWNY